MPKGTGTYGSQVGRPKKQKRKSLSENSERLYYESVGESVINTYRSIGFIFLGEEEDEAELGGRQRHRRFSQDSFKKKVGDSLRRLQQRGAERRRTPQEPFPRGEERRGGTAGRPGGKADRRKPK